jgi:hypothetical protein
MNIKVLKEDVEHHVKEGKGRCFLTPKDSLVKVAWLNWRAIGSTQTSAREQSSFQAGIGQSTEDPHREVIKTNYWVEVKMRY